MADDVEKFGTHMASSTFGQTVKVGVTHLWRQATGSVVAGEAVRETGTSVLGAVAGGVLRYASPVFAFASLALDATPANAAEPQSSSTKDLLEKEKAKTEHAKAKAFDTWKTQRKNYNGMKSGQAQTTCTTVNPTGDKPNEDSPSPIPRQRVAQVSSSRLSSPPRNG